MRTFISTSFIVIIAQYVFCDTPTIRQTCNGPVEGIELISSLGQKYYAFKGIPFAETPITGTDPYTGEQVDRRFKVRKKIKLVIFKSFIIKFYYFIILNEKNCEFINDNISI